MISLAVANADGTAAEISGNGVRIYGKFLLDRGEISGTECHIHTTIGQVRCEFAGNGVVHAAIGPCAVNPTAVALDLKSGKIFGYCARIGNPHFVIPLPRFPQKWQKLAEEIAVRHEFPNGTNVEFVKVADLSSIAVMVWERGVGRTPSCGTGAACCAAVCRKIFGLCDDVKVSMEGGAIRTAAMGSGVRIGGKIKFIASVSIGRRDDL
jgi:diaminopimelate epimerase